MNAGQLAEGNLNEILAQVATDESNLTTATNNVYLAKLSLIQLLQISSSSVDEFEVVVPNLDDLESLKMIDNVSVLVTNALNNFPEMCRLFQ